jgi:hypothetical protein
MNTFFLKAFSHSVLLITGAVASGQSSESELASAKASVQAIIAAMKSYYMEYARWPSVVEVSENSPYPREDLTVGELTFGATYHNNVLCDVLRAIPETSNARHAKNARRHIFLEARTVADPNQPRAGFLDNKEARPEQRGCFFDPWGREYLVRIDYDGSETVNTPYGEAVKAGVIVWSVGPDGKAGTADDITSWR